MDERAAERRILEALGDPDLVDRMATLPGADFTSLLLGVLRARATTVEALDVFRRFSRSARHAQTSHEIVSATEMLAAVSPDVSLLGGGRVAVQIRREVLAS